MNDDTDNKDDFALWQTISQEIKPLQTKKRSETQPILVKEKLHTLKENKVRFVYEPPKGKQLTHLEVGRLEVDKHMAQKLKQGKLAIEATLDLHGHSLLQAHQLLQHFIYRCYEQQKRCVLIITGKGKDYQGALFGSVPAWLNEPDLRPMIVSFTYAVQKHGGQGALYVIIRKARSKTL